MKRSERMKSYGKATAMIAVFVMIAAATACIIPMQAETADGDFDITNGNMQISVGQKKVSIISMNDNAFEFEDSGDGIVLSYATGDNPEDDAFNTLLEYKNNTSGSSGWIWEKTNVAQLSGYTIDVDTSDKITNGESKVPNGTYTLIFTGTDVNESVEKLTIRVKITSHSTAQTLNYEYNVKVYDAFDDKSTITYETTKAVKGGEFNASATVMMNENIAMDEDDLNPFIFYASGLNPGVALMSKDLFIKGSIPDDLNGWSTTVGEDGEKTGSMILDIAVTDTRTGYVYIVDEVSVNYIIADPNGLDYTVFYTAPGSNTGSTPWSATDGDVAATLISDGDLTIEGAGHCVATIIYDDGSKTVTNSVQLEDTPKEIDITGTGVIRIIVSVPGVDEQTLEFTIIDDMIPINDIGVTCGPKITS